MTAAYGSLPFDEQIAFFRKKVNLPTQAWTDLWEGMHSRAFVVAGAMRDDLLSDLRAAVDKGITEGTTLAEFRKDFDSIVKERGWAYNGGRNWRTRVIYDTNLRTSYDIGRFKQMKAVSKSRPYWRYRHNDASTRPRLEHLSWDGLVLKHDDPWWQTHYPRNGWGCKCFVETLSERDLKKLGKDGPDQAPPIEWEEVTVGERGPHPRVVRTPKGIDPGWGYNPGEAAWGREPALSIMERGPFVEVDGWRPDEYPWLPNKLTPKAPPVPVGADPEIEEGLKAAAPEGIYQDKLGEMVNVYAGHRGPHPGGSGETVERTGKYFPLIPDILENPAEVWFGFIRYEDGRYAIRRRYLTAYEVDDSKNRMAGVLADTQDGQLVAFDVIHGSNLKGGRFRFGKLAYPWKTEGERSRRRTSARRYAWR